eukprot:3939311-Rhodomonas_salina.1
MKAARFRNCRRNSFRGVRNPGEESVLYFSFVRRDPRRGDKRCTESNPAALFSSKYGKKLSRRGVMNAFECGVQSRLPSL